MNSNIRNKRKKLLRDSVNLQILALHCDDYEKNIKVRIAQDKKYKQYSFYDKLIKTLEKGA